MPELDIFVTDRPGAESKSISRRVFQYEGLEIEHPISDSRICKFTVPTHDINAYGQSNIQHFKLPYRRMIKVMYRRKLVFWGPIITPKFVGKQGKVEVTAHDPSIWLKRHHFKPGDTALDGNGVDVESSGFETLWQAAALDAAEAAAGYAELPLVVGRSLYFSGFRKFKPVVGDNVWDKTIEMAEAVDGPEFDIVPIDEDHDPTGVWVPGAMGRIDSYAPGDMGGDLEFDTPEWNFGWGRTNLDDYTYEPDGAAVTNRFVAQSDRGGLRVARYDAGMEDMGILESWEQHTLEGINIMGLEAWAEGNVKAYGEPLQAFTIEPVWDQGVMGSAASTPWRYPSGAYPGDAVRVKARFGQFEKEVTGRITKVTLKQQDAAENVKSSIEVIPDEVADVDVDVGQDFAP